MMEQTQVKINWLKPTKVKILALIVILLTCTNLYSYGLYNSAHWDKVYYVDVVPHIELASVMSFYGVDMYDGKILSSSNPGDIAIGKITGFVTFPDLSDQPRDVSQYYEISALNDYDDSRNQLFTLTETIKMDSIPPREFDTEILIISDNTPQTLTLKTESGQTFRINKRTDEVTVIDRDGDISKLITSDLDYRDFMLKFLGHQ